MTSHKDHLATETQETYAKAAKMEAKKEKEREKARSDQAKILKGKSDSNAENEMKHKMAFKNINDNFMGDLRE